MDDASAGKKIILVPGRSGLVSDLKFKLHTNLTDNSAKQINHFLLNNSYLFNFISCSPMIRLFYLCQALSAFCRLEQHIESTCKLPVPGNGFSKSCFVKNIVMSEGGCKNQRIGCMRDAGYELEVHSYSFRLLS